MSVAKSGWSTTKKISEDIKYTHKWSIENFDVAMEQGRGVESDSFHIPGVLGEFKLKTSPPWKTVKLKEFEAKHLFLVSLTFTSVDKLGFELPLHRLGYREYKYTCHDKYGK